MQDKATFQARRDRAVKAWDLGDEVVLVGSGDPIHKPGHFDQCFAYSPHPQYRWLTGSDRCGSVFAYDPQEGWTHFVRQVSDQERVWDGDPPIPAGKPMEDLEGWLKAREGRPVAAVGGAIKGVEGDKELSEKVDIALDHERRAKDASELEIMRRCAAITAEGYKAAAEFIRPGVTERHIQIELETAMYRAGATGMGYHSIVGTGPNSRIFHFTPGDRKVQPDDLVLIDAGAELNGYVIDVTRTFAADREWKGRQAEVHAIVKEALRAACEVCYDGRQWSDAQVAAARVEARGLKDLGLLKSDPDDFCQSGGIAMFLPHGVGHPVGLGVRDSGGRVPGQGEPELVCGVKMRVEFLLRPGYVMTVEPGLYFIPALLNNAEKREQFRDDIDWEKLESWMNFGGLRLEDNLVITDSEPENLTKAIPL